MPTFKSLKSKKDTLLGTEEVNPITGLTFSALKGVKEQDYLPTPYEGNVSSYLDPRDYLNLNTEGVYTNLGSEVLSRERAYNQSGLSQAGNAIVQAVGQVVGGTLEGVGHLGDIKQTTSILDGTEQDFGNLFVDTGRALQTWTTNKFPIYNQPDVEGKFAPSSWSWWMSNVPSVASTLSLLIPTSLATRGLSMAGKSLAMTNELSKIAKVFGTSERIILGIEQASISRLMENGMESVGVHNTIYDDVIKKGGTIKEAKEQAALGAADTWNKNWVMLAQDVPSYILLGTKFGKASGAKVTPEMAGYFGQSVLKPQLAKTLAYSGELLSEGAEEGYQYLVSEHNIELAKQRIDPTYEAKGLEDLMKDGEFWTNSLWGALGAGVFQSAGRLINEKILGHEHIDVKRNKEIIDLGPRIKLGRIAMEKANKLGDEEGYEFAKSRLLNELVGSKAVTGDIDKIELFLDSAQQEKPSQELLDKFGLDEEDIKYMKENFPDLKQKVKEFGQTYESYTSQGIEPDIASEITKMEFNRRDMIKQRDLINKNKSEVLSKLTDFGYFTSNGKDLSITGREIFENRTSIDALNKYKDFLNKRLKLDKDLSEDLKKETEKRLDKATRDIEILSKNNENLNKSPEYSKSQIDEKGNKVESDKVADQRIIDNLIPKKKDKRSKTFLVSHYTILKSAELHLNRAVDYIDEFKKKAAQEQEDRNKGKERPADPTPPIVTEEKTPEVKTPVSDTVEEKPIVEDIQTKLSRIKTTYSSKELHSLFTEYNLLKDVYKDAGKPSQTFGDISKIGDRIVFKDKHGIETDITDQQDKTLDKLGYTLTEEPELSNVPKQEPIDIEDEEDNIVITDIPSEGEGSIISKDDKPIVPTDLSLFFVSYKKRKEIEPNDKRLVDNIVEADRLNNYLSNPNNTLKDSHIEYYINNEYLNDSSIELELRRKIQNNQYEDLTNEEVEQIPIFAKLIDGAGKTITDKLILNTPLTEGDYKYSSYKRKSILIPHEIYELPKNEQKKEISKFLDSVRANNIKLRQLIIKNIILGKTTTSTNLIKSRGIIHNTGTNRNIKEALHINYNDTELYIGTSKGTIVNGAGEVIGYHKGEIGKSGGNVYIRTNKTANGNYIFIKLNPKRISEEHARIILNAFKQGAINGFKEDYKGSNVSGLKINEVLQFLVNSGPRTKKVAVLRPELEEKQLYIENDKLHFGSKGIIDLLNISQKDEEEFITHMQENMNYTARYKTFRDVITKPWKIGSFKVDSNDVKEHLTIQGAILKFNMFLTDVGFTAPESITRDVLISVNLNNTEDIKVESTPIIDKPIVIEPNTKITKNIEKEVNKKIDDKLKNKFGRVANRLYDNKVEYKFEDLPKIVKWINDMLGEGIPIEIKKGLIDIITSTGSKKAYGQVKDAAIILSDKAEIGTGYHEAFHIVSLYMLSDIQRTNLYKNAREQYKQLKDKTDIEVEEFLAEKFREYMLSERKVEPIGNYLQRVFVNLIKWIQDRFTNPAARLSDLTIDNIFNKIEKGYFKDSKVQLTNTQKYSSYEYLRSIESFTTSQTMRIVDGLMAILINVNDLSNSKNIRNIKFEPVLDFIKELRQSMVDEPVQTDLIKHYIDLYDRILKFDPETKTYKTFRAFKFLIDDRLISMNIRHNSSSVENEEGTDFNQEVNSIEEEIRNYDKAVYEFNGRDNTLTNIKYFLSTLPESDELDEYTGMPRLLDFPSVWSRLLRDTHKEFTIEGVQKVIEKKSESSYFYKVLVNGLVDGNDNVIRPGLKQSTDIFRTQFFNTVNKHRHNFVNIVNYKEGKKSVFKVFSADTEAADRDLQTTWSRQFYELGRFFTVDNKPIEKELFKVITDFTDNIEIPLIAEYKRDKSLPNFDKYVDKIIFILAEIGIRTDAKMINDISLDFSPEEKNYGLQKFVSELLTGILGSEGLLKDISSLKTGKLDQYTQKEIEVEKYFKKETKIKELSKLFVKLDDKYVMDTILGPDASTYYTYSQHSFITYFNKYLFSDDNFINSLSNIVGNKHSRFAKQIREKKYINLDTFSSFRTGKNNKGYLDLDSIEDFLVKMHLILNGKLPMPTLADKKTYFVFDNVDMYKLKDAKHENGILTIDNETNEDLYNIFHGYFLDEKARIELVKSDIDKAINSGNYNNLIQNMHYQEVDDNGNPKLLKSDGSPLYNGNGLKYQLFTDFNKVEPSKEGIVKAIQDNILKTLKLADKLGIIQLNLKGDIIYSIKNLLLDADVVAQRHANYQSETKEVLSIITEYAVNTMIGSIETQKMFSMDPAYYKSDKETGSTVEDMIKRISALIAPGDQLHTLYTEGEFASKSELYSTPDKYRVSTIQDYIIDMAIDNPELYKKLHDNFVDLVKEEFPDLSEEGVNKQVEERLKAFKKNNSTDASVYITPSFHRELLIRLGEWDYINDQKAYDLLISGKELTDSEQKIASRLIMQPLKFVHYGIYFEEKYGIPIYDKMAMFTLWPSMVKDKKLQALYDRMHSETSPIDMIKTESAVKSGNRSRIKYLNEKGEVNIHLLDGMSIYEQDLKYLRRQQITDPHEDEERLLATQVKKIVLSNLHLNEKIYKVGDSEELYTGQEVADSINMVYSALSNKGYVELKEKLGISDKGVVDPKKLYSVLRDAAKKSGMPYQVIDALLYEDGKPISNLDLLADRKWVESKLIAVVNKYTIDLMTPGDGFVQMSNFGLQEPGVSDDLELIDSKGRTEIKLSIGFFRDVIPGYKSKTFSERRQYLLDNKELLEGIGYRIPTQSQASCIAFVVKDVLEDATGNTVILPLYFTALTGSDFDIDKLFLARYSYYHRGQDTFKYEFIEPDNGLLATENNTLIQLYQQNYTEQYFLKERLLELKKEIGDSIQDESLIGDRLDYAELKLFRELLDINEDSWNEKRITQEDVDIVMSKLLNNPTEEKYIEKNRNKNVWELNSKKALQNKVIDLMIAPLVNSKHLLETKTPIDAFTSKLRNLAKEFRELRGETKYLSSLESTTPSYQLKVKQSYTEGKKGIGPFALNNVHHALSQLYNLGVRSGLSEDGILNLSGKVGKDNVFILDWFSALINAHVDIAKDPYIFELNVNKLTYNVVSTMLRAGYGENTFRFISQPILQNIPITKSKYKLLVEEYMSTAVALGRQDSVSVEQVTSYVEEISNIDVILKSTKTLKEGIEIINPETNFVNAHEVHTWKWYANQVAILNVYMDINKVSKSLSSAVMNSRLDSKGYGTNLYDVFNFASTLENTYNDKELVNFKEMMDKSFLGTLKVNALDTILNVYKDLTLASSIGYRTVSTSLTQGLKNPFDQDEHKSYDKKVKSIHNEVYSSMIGQYFLSPTGFALTEEVVKDLFIGKDSVGSRLYNILNKEEYKDLADNELIKHLKSVEDVKDRLWFVKATVGDKSDKWIRDVVTDAWEELLEDPRKEVKDLARDLVYIAFYTSGFNRKLYSFYHNIPLKYLMQKPEHLENKEVTRSFNEYITDMLKYFNSSDIDPDFLNKIKVDVIRNNPELFIDKIASLHRFHDTEINGKSIKIAFSLQKVEPLGYNTNNKPIYSLITVVNEVVGEYIGTLNGDPIYRIIGSLGTDHQGHQLKEYGLKKSILDKNNKIVLTDAQVISYKYGESKIDYIEPLDRIIVKDELPEPKKLTIINDNNMSKINFQEESTTGYRNRTIKNASADATIAIAVDFNSAGEKLTKTSVLQQNKKYISVDANNLDISKGRVDKIVTSLNSVNAKTLNIAGNGIYTVKGKYTQQQIDDFTYNLLKEVINSPNLKTKIENIRTGGQTGFDEAGAKAGVKLGLPTKILAPKGWTFRNINGQDISNEDQFKDRFNIEQQTIQPTAEQQKMIDNLPDKIKLDPKRNEEAMNAIMNLPQDKAQNIIDRLINC